MSFSDTIESRSRLSLRPASNLPATTESGRLPEAASRSLATGFQKSIALRRGPSAYDNYLALYKQQAAILDRLPVHLRGELLGGLAQAAQRTGRKEEMNQYVDKILAVLGGTPYEPIAKKWKANPESAANTSITCMTCHDGGRLVSATGRDQQVSRSVESAGPIVRAAETSSLETSFRPFFIDAPTVHR